MSQRRKDRWADAALWVIVGLVAVAIIGYVVLVAMSRAPMT